MIFTFYSFKGGVGRSMSMATVAYLMAQRGLKVLTIDFDLEAPGLERYFFDEPNQLAEVRSNFGLIDLVLAYKRALTSEAEFQRAEFKNWRSFIVDAIPRTPKGGSVDLMTSGRRHPEPRLTEYALAVRGFDWQDFFHNWRGDRFFEWLRAQLTAAMDAYDVVLVDSRTGVTEMGGICAYQLADAAVLMCAPNYQNLDGTRAVVSDFRSAAVLALRAGRPLDILVLPARVEQSDHVKRDRFFEDLERTFGTEGLPKVLADAGLTYRTLAIPYRPELAIIERLVDETAAGSSGALVAKSEARTAYETLTDALMLMTSGDRWTSQRELARKRLAGESGTVDTVPDVTQRAAGYDAFIESRQDERERVAPLVQMLRDRGVSLWWPGDHGPTDLPPEAQKRAIDYSHALVLCAGSATPSQWSMATIAAFQKRQKPIVVVLMPGLENPGLWLRLHDVADTDAIDLRGGITEAETTRLLDAIRRERPAEARSKGETARPYPGPSPFGEEDTPFFHEREADTTALHDAFSEHDVVLLEGGTGVGKTSLVRAGLLPGVRRAEGAFALGDGKTAWTVLSIDAGYATAEQWDQIERGDAALPALWVLDSVDSFPDDGTAAARNERMRRILQVVRRADRRNRMLLVWRGSLAEDERRAWLDACATAGSSRFAVVPLAPLSPPALRAVIDKPAGAVGHLLEPGLSERLLRDAGATVEHASGRPSPPGVVAQIQIALGDIWAKRTRGWLTNKAYDEAGGIAGRFNARLQAVVTPEDLTGDTAAAVLLRGLLQFDAQLAVQRQFRHWDTLASIPAVSAKDAIALRDVLARERLLDLWLEEDRVSCALSQPTPGPLLESLVRADVPFLLWRQRFASYVHAYVKSGRAATALLVGDPLSEATPWRSTHADQLSRDEHELIDASVAAERQRGATELERQRLENERLTAARDRAEEERRRAEAERARAEAESSRAMQVARRNARLARITAVLTLAALIGAGVTFWQRNQLRAQGKQIAVQAALLGARRLATTDPTAAIVGLAASTGDDLSQDAVLRALAFLPDQPLARARVLHEQPITHAMFLPDQRIVTASADAIRFWNVDGQVQWQLPIDVPPVALAATKAAPGTALSVVAALSSGKILTVDIQGQISREVSLGVAIPLGASVSPDGRLLAVPSDTGGLGVWTAEGHLLWSVPSDSSAAITTAVFDPSATNVLTIASGELRLWSVATGELRQHVTLPALAVTEARFSPSGDRVALGVDDGVLRVWDLAADAVRVLGDPLVGFRDRAGVRRVAFSADGKFLASAFNESTARVWDSSGKLAAALHGRDIEITGIEFSPAPEPRLLTMSADGLATIWELLPDENEAGMWRGRVAAELQGHTGGLLVAAFDQTGNRVITGGRDLSARLWNWRERLPFQLAFDASVTDIESSPSGDVAILGLADGRSFLWRFASGDVQPLETHTDAVNRAAFNPRGDQVVTASLDAVRLTSVADRKSVVLSGQTGLVIDVVFSPDGQRIVTASSDGVARVWDPRGALLASLRHDGAVTRVRFSSDGRTVLTASADATAKLWAVASSQMGALLQHTSEVNIAAFSPQGDYVLTAAQGDGLRVWGTDGRVVRTLAGMTPDERVMDAGFSPDGSKIAAVMSGVVLLWPPGNTQPVRFAAGEDVFRVEWATDDLVVTASLNGEGGLWATDGRRVAALRPGPDALTRATFTANGQYLLTSSLDGTARAWPLSPQAFRARVAQTAMRCLSAREWEDFFLVDPTQAQARSKTCETGSRGRAF